jgi:hypothetical protein
MTNPNASQMVSMMIFKIATMEQALFAILIAYQISNITNLKMALSIIGAKIKFELSQPKYLESQTIPPSIIIYRFY